jgi:multiple sugar transport system substrate-binding protein
MKSTTRRISLLALFALASATVLSGCGPNDSNGGGAGDTTITIGYAGGGAVDTYMSTIIKHVKKELPDVTIKTAVYPTYDDQLNQLPTQFAAGTAPDVILWDNSAPIAQYATEGAIQPISDLVKDTDVDLSLYPEALVKGWTIDGDLYAVPDYLQNSAYAFNRDVLGAAGVTETPATLDQLASSAEAVKQATGKPGIVLLDNLFHLTQYMLAFGGGYDFGKTINSKENVAGLDYLLGLFKSGAAATAKQVGATWDGEALANGQAAMSDGGPWYIGFMSTTAPDVNYDLTPIPGVDPGAQIVATYGGGFSVSASTNAPETAVSVIASLTDEVSQEAVISTGLGFVPAMTEYANQYREATPKYAPFTEEILASGKSLDYPIKTTEFGNDLVAGFQQLVASGETSSKDLLDSLQEEYGR